MCEISGFIGSNEKFIKMMNNVNRSRGTYGVGTYIGGFYVYILPISQDGLGILFYYAGAVLTGLETMSREVSRLVKIVISLFPRKIILSFDQALIDDEKYLLSSNVKEMLDLPFKIHIIPAFNNFKKSSDM